MHREYPPAKSYVSQGNRLSYKRCSDYIFDCGILALGEWNIKFEQRFNTVQGLSGDCVTVNSCSSALFLIYQALGLKGKHVVVPTNTFFSTAAAAIHAGAIVSFADMEEETLCVSLDTIKEVVTEDTAAIVVVHIGGVIPPDMEDIVNYCTDHDIYLIEDCAHAHGCSLNGTSAGDFGFASAFSFYPTKIMTTGEGGIVHSMDSQLLFDVRCLRDHGKSVTSANIHEVLGFNWRMSEHSALLGYLQCMELDQTVENRSRMCSVYTSLLSDSPDCSPLKYNDFLENGLLSSFYKYVVRLKLKPDLLVKLKDDMRSRFNVCLSGNVYDVPLHLQPVFVDLIGSQVVESSCPVAERVCVSHVCLPVYSDMTAADVFHIGQNFVDLVSELTAEDS
jgi:perosamine synthetase